MLLAAQRWKYDWRDWRFQWWGLEITDKTVSNLLQPVRID